MKEKKTRLYLINLFYFIYLILVKLLNEVFNVSVMILRSCLT